MTEHERLAVVEVEVKTTKETVNRIEDKLDKLVDSITHNYVPRGEIVTMVEAVKTDIGAVRQQRWYFGMLSGIAGSVAGGLVGFFISHLTR